MKKVVYAALVGALVSTMAYAAPGGFNNQPNSTPGGFNAPKGVSTNNVVTAQDVINNAYDDQYVTLRGCLTKQLGRELYEFTDQKGTKILVDLDDDMPWNHIQKDQLIEIVGEVDRDINNVKIDVKRAVAVQ